MYVLVTLLYYFITLCTYTALLAVLSYSCGTTTHFDARHGLYGYHQKIKLRN